MKGKWWWKFMDSKYDFTSSWSQMTYVVRVWLLVSWGNATGLVMKYLEMYRSLSVFLHIEIFNFNLPFYMYLQVILHGDSMRKKLIFLLTWSISIGDLRVILNFQPTDLELAACWFPTFAFVCVRRFPHILLKHPPVWRDSIFLKNSW